MRKNQEKSPLCGGKLIMLLLLCITEALSLTSCSKGNNDNTEKELKTSLKFKGAQPAEIVIYNADGSSQKGTSNDMAASFGKRLNLAAPMTLLFNDDMLTIGKQAGLTETYKTKWDGNKLLLLNETTGQWTECGSKTSNGTMTMTMGFYRQEVGGSGRQLISFGQGYGLNTTDAVAPTSGTTKVVWVKMVCTVE